MDEAQAAEATPALKTFRFDADMTVKVTTEVEAATEEDARTIAGQRSVAADNEKYGDETEEWVLTGDSSPPSNIRQRSEDLPQTGSSTL